MALTSALRVVAAAVTVMCALVPDASAGATPACHDCTKAIPPRVPHASAGVWPRPGILWAATQFIPSPEWAVSTTGLDFGLRWQLTPLLYSWGVNRRVSPWRMFVVEPNYRCFGGAEFYLAPAWLSGAHGGFYIRPGARLYMPVLEHGETFSLSLGASWQRIAGDQAVSLEAGAYILASMVGVQFSYAPKADGPHTAFVTLQLRYF